MKISPRSATLLLVLLSLAIGPRSQADKPAIRYQLNGEQLAKVELTALPALSADGRTLIARSETRDEISLVDTVQATKWGGMRTSYDFESGAHDETENRQRMAGVKRLEKMIRRRGFQKLTITPANRHHMVRVGEFIVELKNGRLRFSEGETLLFAREIATRYSRGAGLMSQEAVDALKVSFEGAYIDPDRRVFVVAYGSGECDCACDLAPFYELYRWGKELPARRASGL